MNRQYLLLPPSVCQAIIAEVEKQHPRALVDRSFASEYGLALDLSDFAVVSNGKEEPEPTAAADLLAACKFVKQWFLNLENGTTEDDPLTRLRRRFHKPVHKRLDAAIAKAEGKS